MTSSPTTSTGKRNSCPPTYYGFESLVCLISESESVSAPKKQRTYNPLIATIIQEESTQQPPEETSFESPVVNPIEPGVCPLTNSPPDYDSAENERESSMHVVDAKKNKSKGSTRSLEAIEFLV